MACGAGVRAYQAHSASVIARDGIGYVNMARSMQHDWRAGVPELVQFGYPLLIKWAYPLVAPRVAGDELMQWQRTAQFVSILSGTLCIPAVYWLGRRLLSRRVGLLAAWGWALLPNAVSFSADALSDMPCLMFILWACILAMIGLRRRSIGHLVWAGLFSGAAYAIREEGGAVALVALVLALVRGRVSLFWRGTAALAVVAGFAILGGSYIWIEGGTIFSEKPYLHVEHWHERGQTFLATHVEHSHEWGRSLAEYAGRGAGEPLLAAFDYRPLSEQIKDVFHARWATLAARAGTSLHQLLLEMGNSLNGVWLILAGAYLFLPGRRRFRKGWRRLPILLVTVHAIILLLLFDKCGYLSRRHVMLLDVWAVIVGAGTLTWIAGRITSRLRLRNNKSLSQNPEIRPAGSLPRRDLALANRSHTALAKRADALILTGIVLATLPWLLRDVGDGRWFVHDAAGWIREQYPTRSNVRIVCDSPWVPFYARQSRWDLVKDDPTACPALAHAELLILDRKAGVPPPVVAVRGTSDRLHIVPVVRFDDAGERRGVIIYRVKRSPATAPAE